MLPPTQGLSLFGGDTWLSCHTDVLLAYFILIIRCCKWQPIYPFTCIIHKTYFLKQKPSDPTSRNKISNQPTTHILSSFCGRYGVLLWLCVFQWTVGEGETKWGKLRSTGLRKKKTINRCWACTCQISLVSFVDLWASILPLDLTQDLPIKPQPPFPGYEDGGNQWSTGCSLAAQNAKNLFFIAIEPSSLFPFNFWGIGVSYKIQLKLNTLVDPSVISIHNIHTHRY